MRYAAVVCRGPVTDSLAQDMLRVWCGLGPCCNVQCAACMPPPCSMLRTQPCSTSAMLRCMQCAAVVQLLHGMCPVQHIRLAAQLGLSRGF